MFCRWSLALISCITFAAADAAAQITFHRADYPSQSGARAIAVADFNRDGWPDVAHASAGADSVTILLNQRDAAQGLRRQFDIPVGHGPFDMATADFNRDNIPDLAVANADNDTISVLLGDGTGRFSRADLAAPGNPRGITTTDFNRDGRTDIVFTGFLNNRVQVLLGAGDGSFSVGVALVGVANMPQGIAAADFNNDGRPDFVVAYASAGGGLAILRQTSAGSLSATKVSSDPLNVVTAADLNRDGWMDVAAASSGYNRMDTFYGSASGLAPHRSYLTGSSPRGIGTADINQDGWIDVLTANKESNTVTVFRAPPHPSGWHVEQHFAAGRGSRGLALADYDHDGLIDVATGNQDEGSVTLLWNMTPLVRAGFAFARVDGGYGFDAFFNDVIVADFDHDGRLDRVNGSGDVYFGNGSELHLGTHLGGRLPADVNRDGHLDIVYVDGTARSVGTLLGNGSGGFTAGASAAGWDPAFFPAADSLGVADVDRDGDVDIVVRGNQSAPGGGSTGVLYVHKGTGDGSFAAPTRTSMPSGPRAWLGDVDGDGKVDLLFSQFNPTVALGVAYGDGTGAFPTIAAYPAQDSIVVPNVADINHDGRPDVVSGTFSGTHIHLGQAGGGLAPPTILPGDGYRVSLGDLDGDGHLDIVSNNAVSVRFGRGDGTFGEPQRFASFGSRPIVADMNNDGLNDIVVGDSVGVLLNRRQAGNTVPTVQAPPDATYSYADTFQFDEDDTILLTPQAFDADMHDLRYEWRDAAGNILSTDLYLRLRNFNPGTHELTVTVNDERGGSASDRMLLTILPVKEIVLHSAPASTPGDTWTHVQDATAASGIRVHDPNQGAPKVNTPLAEPSDHVEIWFIADPTQTYKLWIRGKAESDYWGNDSAWVQFEHSLNTAGAPAYRIGTADALPFNLEECSGCGVSGWGWEDDGWGRVDQHGTTIRFAQGGWQRLRIQRREDGVSIDQIVLSAERYLTTRPGAAKNDTTILPRTR